MIIHKYTPIGRMAPGIYYCDDDVRTVQLIHWFSWLRVARISVFFCDTGPPLVVLCSTNIQSLNSSCKVGTKQFYSTQKMAQIIENAIHKYIPEPELIEVKRIIYGRSDRYNCKIALDVICHGFCVISSFSLSTHFQQQFYRSV